MNKPSDASKALALSLLPEALCKPFSLREWWFGSVTFWGSLFQGPSTGRREQWQVSTRALPNMDVTPSRGDV